MRSLRTNLLIAWTALGLSGAALAHHSTAAYDYTKKVTLTGTVRQFQWTNPHCYIQLLVSDTDGHQVEWSIESGTPSVSASLGWNKNSVKAGDKVTVVLSPMKSGGRAGTLSTITLPDGQVLRGVAANVKTDKEGTPNLVPTLPTLKPATPNQP
jgi:hypothetical protein